ncbi:FtsB family cell division protein [Ideonella livida]|uniref:Cell division protein FtsB n=1 Tax=Ideonella livida TaxID=2707176 RepID=A0A7C9TJA4_9BURK|nr:septum formation initiator family protein [Ideonella livida]NDY90823.1 septation ring formation regulator EzrA [Ideonella livida]
MRLLLILQLLLLAGVHFALWVGDNGVANAASLEREKQQAQAANAAKRAEIARLQAELADLVEGTEVVEDWARGQQAMVKPGETLVQFIQR